MKKKNNEFTVIDVFVSHFNLYTIGRSLALYKISFT